MVDAIEGNVMNDVQAEVGAKWRIQQNPVRIQQVKLLRITRQSAYFWI